MDDTLFVGNTSEYGGGAYLELGAALECAGDKKTSAGFLANEAVYDDGGVSISTGTLSSVSCDWGVVGSADDNTGDVSVSKTNYGDDETFTCTESGCK